MATFANKNIQDSYFGIIKTDNNCLLTEQSGQINLTDAHGNSSSISIGKRSDTAGIDVCGPLTVSGTTVLNDSITVTSGSANLGAVTASGKICTLNTLQTKLGGVLRCVAVGCAHFGDTNSPTTGTNVSYESIQLKGNHNLRFFFNEDQKAMLRNNGNMCVNGKFTSNGICSTDTVAINGDVLATDGTFSGNVTARQAIRAEGDVIAFYSSDKNLKNNIKELDTNNIIDCINSYEFEWNDKAERKGKGLGFLAQEVKEVLPHAVKENSNGYLGVDYIQFIPVLLKEIKDLKARVKELEA